MSESRQRFTGRVWREALFLAGWGSFIWIFVNTLPLFTTKLQIHTVEPWLLGPEDLTWKRLVINILSKPGIKTMIVGLMVVIGACWRSGKGYRIDKSTTKVTRSSFSLEWVIDSTKSSNLIEYGSFVEAV